MHTTKAAPLSRRAIRSVTNKIREIFNIPVDKPFPIMRLLELLVDKNVYEMDIAEDSEMGSDYAKAFPDKKLIRIRNSTYEGACRGNPRDIFTIAHEFGHLILHTSDRIAFARSDNDVKVYEDPEWQANTFAGELLVPVNYISGLSIDDIKNRYHVSKEVAQIQSTYRVK